MSSFGFQNLKFTRNCFLPTAPIFFSPVVSMDNDFPEFGWLIALITYTNYALLLFLGHFRDFLRNIFGVTRFKNDTPKKGFAILLKSWESFYTRRLYYRIRDCWSRPIASSPGKYIEVMERTSSDWNYTFEYTQKTIKCLNLGSYNYLGFADNWQDSCGKDVKGALCEWPINLSSSRMDFGTVSIHGKLEDTLARFLKKEAVIVFSMGYGTNSSTIPSLMGPGSLIISDALNHTSIVNGARSSGAVIRVFKHNDVKQLESVIRDAIIQGQPKHHRPWRKILVMVEGIYSMEGTVCRLKEVVAIAKKYKAYLYVDEAHSIGAIGATGRGVCEYTGVDPSDVDILMGTFTKSFGGMGGYIAGSKEMIDYLKSSPAGMLVHNAMSPVVCQQVLTALRVIVGEDGTKLGREKIQSLADNSRYFHNAMVRLGLHVYGEVGSPIVPIMVYLPAKLGAFSRECLKRGLAVVVVGFPATSVILSRVRFCLSASLTREDLDFAIRVIDEVSSLLMMKYNKNVIGWA